MKRLALIYIFVLHPLVVLSHQNTPIKLENDGSLTGLPEQYSQAIFEPDTFTLYIGDNCIVIPECIKIYFKNYDHCDIRFSASWYHDPELLPFYLSMEVVNTGQQFGYQILFELENLNIFQISRPEMTTKEDGEVLYKFNYEEISDNCKIQIANSISKR